MDKTMRGISVEEKQAMVDRVNKWANPGAKHDTGKLPVGSIFVYWPRAIKELARVVAHGESLHGYNTWPTISNPERRYMEAQARHELEFAMGHVSCPDSKLHHLAHEAFNVLSRLELELRKGERK